MTTLTPFLVCDDVYVCATEILIRGTPYYNITNLAEPEVYRDWVYTSPLMLEMLKDEDRKWDDVAMYGLFDYPRNCKTIVAREDGLYVPSTLFWDFHLMCYNGSRLNPDIYKDGYYATLEQDMNRMEHTEQKELTRALSASEHLSEQLALREELLQDLARLETVKELRRKINYYYSTYLLKDLKTLMLKQTKTAPKNLRKHQIVAKLTKYTLDKQELLL